MDRIALKLNSPVAALGIGLVAFPLAKLLYIPNYVFNFLTTLVHECGHSLCAWLMGMPSIPTVSVAGGGVTVWGQQHWIICVLVLAGLVVLAWRSRQTPWLWISLAVAALIYPFLAFTGARELVATGGGVLLECLGAAACFFTVVAVQLERPFERPLYALWGWWMILNRGGETILMMRSPAYRESQAVIDSGLAAGLTSDLEMLRQGTQMSPNTLLAVVLILCIAALPVALLAAWLRRTYVSRSE